MKMELLENGCLKIVLSNDELEEMGLTFERLDYRNMETQRTIQRLLQIARQETAHAFHHFFGTFRVTVEPAGGNIVRVVEALHQGTDFLIFD